MGSKLRNFRLITITLMLFITVFSINTIAVSAAETASNAVPAFKDVAAANADLAYINYLAGKGIITGYPDGTFHPAEALTRAQAAVVLVKSGDITIDPNAPSPFKDLNQNHWARPYIAAAVKAGYISGFPDKTFQPEQQLSRAQAITLILKLSKQPLTATLPNLTDINNSHWAAQAAAVGLASGMVGLSDDGQFLPDAPFSRINMAHALGILFSQDPGLNASSLPGQVKAVQGKTVIIKAGSQTEEALQGTNSVNIGDTIKTDKGASAELSYPDGSSMLIKESSLVKIKEAKGRKYIKTNGQEGIAIDWLNLDMKQGTMFTALAAKHEGSPAAAETKTTGAKTHSIAALNGIEYIADAASDNNQEMPWYEASKTKKVKVKVDMPWGVAAVRGTFVMINVSSSGQASVSCLTGSAEVTNAGQTIPLGQNQSTQLTTQDAPPPPPAPMPPAAVQQFAQVQTWIQETARMMDQNQEQTAPAPPAALIAQSQQVPAPVQQTTTVNNGAMTTLQAINSAMGSIGISAGNSAAFPTPTSDRSSGGSGVTVSRVDDIIASVTQGNPYQLPANVTVVMSNEVKTEMPVTWSSSNPDTSTARTLTITGTLTGLTNQVKLILTVERKLGVAVPVESGTPMIFSGGIKIDLGSMTIPNGATVKVDTVVPADLQTSGLQTGGPVVSIKFENMSISQAEISLPVSPGLDASKAGIYYYNEDTKKWQYQPGTLVNGVLKATVSHFSTYGVLLDTTAPTNPSITPGNATSSSIELNLSATDNSGDNCIKSYEIYRDGQKIGTATNNLYTDSNLASDHQYNYQIKAIDRLDNKSDYSPTVTIQTLSAILPAIQITGLKDISTVNGHASIDFQVSPADAEVTYSYSPSGGFGQSSYGTGSGNAQDRWWMVNNASQTVIVTVTASKSGYSPSTQSFTVKCDKSGAQLAVSGCSLMISQAKDANGDLLSGSKKVGLLRSTDLIKSLPVSFANGEATIAIPASLNMPVTYSLQAEIEGISAKLPFTYTVSSWSQVGGELPYSGVNNLSAHVAGCSPYVSMEKSGQLITKVYGSTWTDFNSASNAKNSSMAGYPIYLGYEESGTPTTIKVWKDYTNYPSPGDGSEPVLDVAYMTSEPYIAYKETGGNLMCKIYSNNAWRTAFSTTAPANALAFDVEKKDTSGTGCWKDFGYLTATENGVVNTYVYSKGEALQQLAAVNENSGANSLAVYRNIPYLATTVANKISVWVHKVVGWSKLGEFTGSKPSLKVVNNGTPFLSYINDEGYACLMKYNYLGGDLGPDNSTWLPRFGWIGGKVDADSKQSAAAFSLDGGNIYQAYANASQVFVKKYNDPLSSLIYNDLNKSLNGTANTMEYSINGGKDYTDCSASTTTVSGVSVDNGIIVRYKNNPELAVWIPVVFAPVP